MRCILVLFLCVAHTSFSKSRFVRVVFNSNASKEATILWDQYRGHFLDLYIDTVPPSRNNFAHSKNLTNENHAKGMHTCSIKLSDLKPSTKYYFAIKDTEGIGRTYYFSTVSNNPNDRLSLIAGGDSRDVRTVRVKANKMVAKLKPHAVLFNGDFINLDLNHQWKEWFEDWEYTIGADGRITPLVVSRGNHERSNKVIVHLFAVPHRKLFYNTEFGGNLINVISLNSEILKIGGQKIFLRKTLEEHKDYYWQLPQYHRPIRAHVKFKKEMNTQYRNFVPLFEKYKNVRLCLENDSHTCKITWPILSSKKETAEEGFERNDSLGIVYAGEGCWGAPLRTPDDLKSWTRDAGKVNQFNLIFVSKSKIELRTVMYENVDSVDALRESERFNLPSNLNLFGPNNGKVVDILPATDRK